MKSNMLLFTAIAATALLLTACSSAKSQDSMGQMDMSNNTTGMVKPTIEFSTSPAKVQAGQAVQLTERVTENGKPDAKADIEMEIWRDGDSNHQKVKPTAGDNGTYELEHTFPQAGLYHVRLHTTAGGMHQMPIKDLQVSP